MRARMWACLITIAIALPVSAGFTGRPDTAAVLLSPAPVEAQTNPRLTIEFFDFFNVPFGEWWDYRTLSIGELPINAECFNATSVQRGVCTPEDPGVPDLATYPYTNWFPLGIIIGVGGPPARVYAPYRMHAAGTDVPGYTLSEPVFLPILDGGEPPGHRLEFAWRTQYLTADRARKIDERCGTTLESSLDGFHTESTIRLTMDLQQSRRVFGVQAADPSEAAAWWSASTDPRCPERGTVEEAVQGWFVAMGGRFASPGKYDVYAGFQWVYTPFLTEVTAAVDVDGTTHVTIGHIAWGTEVLVARFFYWGGASYWENYLDSTKARGWLGMEAPWFEDVLFAGSLGPTAFHFSLATTVQYHFQHLCFPGPNGVFDRLDDVPYWTWGPKLADEVRSGGDLGSRSELDRYPLPEPAYSACTPGSWDYGQRIPFDYVPIVWDLDAGESWTFRFPARDLLLYDPNLTPIGADPRREYVARLSDLGLLEARPAGLGTWDALTNTWTLVGPLSTGGPSGAPGDYPLEPLPAIALGPRPLDGDLRVDLTGRAAWPEKRHWDASKDVDGRLTLFAKVANLGNAVVLADVIFELRDEAGNPLFAVKAGGRSIGLGETAVLAVDLPDSLPSGLYLVVAQVIYDRDGDGSIDSFGVRVKQFSLRVLG